MYGFVLAIHNILRWVVLIAGLAAVIQAYRGWFGDREWTGVDRNLGILFTSFLDTQLLLGLLLYIVYSPISRAAFQDFGAAMGDSVTRFFAVEHVFYTVLAVVLGHVGTISAKRASNSKAKHQRTAIFFTVILLLLVVGIPWPWGAISRPLIRGLG